MRQQYWWKRWMFPCALLMIIIAAGTLNAQTPRGMLTFSAAKSDGGSTIYMVNANGQGLRRVLTNGRDPSFAPDGTTIIFVRGQDIYMANRGGQNLRKLTNHGLGVTISNPVISQDRTIILFNEAPVVPNPVTHIQLFRTDGSGEMTLSPGMDPSLTPDQVQIFFANNNAIYSMSRSQMAGNPYTPSEVWRPSPAMMVRYPVFGRGSFPGIVFAGSTAANQWSILAVYFGQQQWQQRVLATDASAPAFSPDGNFIAFVRNGDLYIMRADGTGQRRLVTGIGTISRPSWFIAGVGVG